MLKLGSLTGHVTREQFDDLQVTFPRRQILTLCDEVAVGEIVAELLDLGRTEADYPPLVRELVADLTKTAQIVSHAQSNEPERER